MRHTQLPCATLCANYLHLSPPLMPIKLTDVLEYPLFAWEIANFEAEILGIL
jgi:hypothetical protein